MLRPSTTSAVGSGTCADPNAINYPYWSMPNVPTAWANMVANYATSVCTDSQGVQETLWPDPNTIGYPAAGWYRANGAGGSG
jgi:hypothetical protein